MTRHLERAFAASRQFHSLWIADDARIRLIYREITEAFSVIQLWTVMNTPDGVETPLYVAETG
jgi:hypothetical protein